jgi:hypothetical protein
VIAYEQPQPIIDHSSTNSEKQDNGVIVGYDATYWLRVYRFPLVDPIGTNTKSARPEVAFEDIRIPGSMPITAVAIDIHPSKSGARTIYYAVEQDTHVFRTLTVHELSASELSTTNPKRTFEIRLSTPAGPLRERFSKITKTVALVPYTGNTNAEEKSTKPDEAQEATRALMSVEFRYDAHARISSFHSQISAFIPANKDASAGVWKVTDVVTKGYSRKKEHGTLQYKHPHHVPEAVMHGLTIGTSRHRDLVMLITSPYLLTIVRLLPVACIVSLLVRLTVIVGCCAVWTGFGS